MGYRTGAGGFVTITKNADDQLDAPYAAKAFAKGSYEADDIVYTADTNNPPGNVTFWRSKQDRAASGAVGAVGGDVTKAGAAGAAAELDPNYWDKLEVGTLYGLQNWTLTRPVTEDSSLRLLKEAAPRTTYGAGAATLELNFLDNFAGSPLQRSLEVPNARVYVRLFPTGKKTGNEVVQGYMRVGQSTHASGDGDTYLTRSVTLAADGPFQSSVQ